MKARKAVSFIISILIMAVLITLDQVSKFLVNKYIEIGSEITVINPVLYFTHAENTGAAWSILSGKQILFIVLTIVMVLVILFVYFRTPYEKKYSPFRYTLVVLTSGAIGNLIDRIRFGTVTDFIKSHFIYYWIMKKDFPIYNIADICVTLSMVALILLILIKYKDHDFDYLFPKKKTTNADLNAGNASDSATASDSTAASDSSVASVSDNSSTVNGSGDASSTNGSCNVSPTFASGDSKKKAHGMFSDSEVYVIKKKEE